MTAEPFQHASGKSSWELFKRRRRCAHIDQKIPPPAGPRPPSLPPRNDAGRAGDRLVRKWDLFIVFAWLLEIVCVSCGFVAALYTTFGPDIPTTLIGLLPAVPMIALSATELARIPLAQAVYSKRRLVCIGTSVAILFLGGIAFENMTFGIERIVTLRLKPVIAAQDRRSAAQVRVEDLTQNQQAMAREAAGINSDVRDGIKKDTDQIAALQKQLREEADTHVANLTSIRDACRIIPGECIRPRSAAEDARYESEVSALNADLATARHNLSELQKRLVDRGPHRQEAETKLENELRDARQQLEDRTRDLRAAIHANQIYRLAGIIFRVNPEEITTEQFDVVRGGFSSYGALAIAFVGTILALVHYAPNRNLAEPSEFAKLLRATRAWVGRRRKNVIRIETRIEKVVEKVEVPRLVEVIKLVFHRRTIIRWLPYSGSGPVPAPSETFETLEGDAAAAEIADLHFNKPGNDP